MLIIILRDSNTTIEITDHLNNYLGTLAVSESRNLELCCARSKIHDIIIKPSDIKLTKIGDHYDNGNLQIKHTIEVAGQLVTLYVESLVDTHDSHRGTCRVVIDAPLSIKFNRDGIKNHGKNRNRN